MRSATGRDAGLALDGDAMAVVVQALVPARAAAIVFTRHPVSGRSDQLLINAAPGLGEAMVSGTGHAGHDRGRQGHAVRSAEFTPGDSVAAPRSPTTSVTSWSGSPRRRAGVRRPGRHRGRPRRRRLVPPPGPPDHDALGASMTSEFPIEWHDPSDAEITWEWDDMHMPGALSALGGDYVLRHRDGDGIRARADRRPRSRCGSGSGTGTPTSGSGRTSRKRSRPRCGNAGPRKRGRPSRLADAYWHERAVPEVRAAYAWVAARPVETMPAADLAETWDEVWDADRSLLVDPLLRDPRAVPGPRRPGRPVRVDHRDAGAGRGARTDRWRRPRAAGRSNGASRSWRRSWPRTPGLAERLDEPRRSHRRGRLAASPEPAEFASALRRSSSSTATSARTSTT